MPSAAWSFPSSDPAIGGAALLTFMTSLGSFSAPSRVGGGFRVMTTQIVPTRLNGDNELAMVETISLTLLALVGGWPSFGVPMPPTPLAVGKKGVAPARIAREDSGLAPRARRPGLDAGRPADAATPHAAARLLRAGGELDGSSRFPLNPPSGTT